MQNKFTAVIFALLLSVCSFAGENVQGTADSYWDKAFRKFSMGIMAGLGPSYLTGAERYYHNEDATGFTMMFEMAYPLNDVLFLRGEIGFDGIFDFGSEYEYQHREVRDSVLADAFEMAVVLNRFLTESFFVGIGPSVRFPWFEEVVEIEDDEVFSGEPEYGNDLWLDVVFVAGFKVNSFEFGLRSGYEFLGFYKETKKYYHMNIHELRFRFYLAYWFGQKHN
jgi:hypothetical protein